MEISWTDHVRNEMLFRVKEQRNILHEICKRKANWIGDILRRNWLLQRIVEGKVKRGIDVTGGCRKLMDDFNPLTPNDPYRGRTAPLTSKVAFYIFIQQI